MYYPKNKISTNQFTKPGEFRYKTTKSTYLGYYWIDSTGKFYTGKNPNDKPNIELEKIKNSQDDIEDLDIKIVGVYSPNLNFENNNNQLVSSYIKLKGIKLEPLKNPPPHSPIPTPQDYNNGEFIRFFLKVINQDKYYEVNKQTYEAIRSQNPNWSWERFTPFKLRWKITGDKEKIKIFNQKEIGKAERDLGKEGFLKFNLLQFYK